MTDFSDATEDAEDRLDLYSSWQKEIGGGETAQYFKCLYCFFSNSDCVAPPKKLRQKVLDIAANIDKLALGQINVRRQTVVAAPAVPATEDQPARAAVAAQYVYDLRPLDAGEISVLKADIQNACSPLAMQLKKPPYTPHAENLACHNGAVDPNDSPNAACVPVRRDRSTKAIAAKREARQNVFTKTVLELEQIDENEPGTPRKKSKKYKDPERELKELIRGLEADIASLEEDRSLVPSARRGPFTSKINKAQKKLDSAKERLAVLNT
ncbi:hypothetical protein HBI18_252150 [Parastagonospora nodorum]|nr:hypothetical protein HBI18_252150 [Parastagonospora nodorum]